LFQSQGGFLRRRDAGRSARGAVSIRGRLSEQVSIPGRVSTASRLFQSQGGFLGGDAVDWTGVSIPGRVSTASRGSGSRVGVGTGAVSIPGRVSTASRHEPCHVFPCGEHDAGTSGFNPRAGFVATASRPMIPGRAASRSPEDRFNPRAGSTASRRRRDPLAGRATRPPVDRFNPRAGFYGVATTIGGGASRQTTRERFNPRAGFVRRRDVRGSFQSQGGFRGSTEGFNPRAGFYGVATVALRPAVSIPGRVSTASRRDVSTAFLVFRLRCFPGRVSTASRRGCFLGIAPIVFSRDARTWESFVDPSCTRL